MRKWIQAVAIAVPLLMAAQVAWSIPAEIEEVTLFGAGFTQWDPDENSGCEASTGYTPADDGVIDDGTTEDSDAFDGGLLLVVGTETFEDANGVGNLVGQSLSVGPDSLEGLQVSRTDRALGSSPTLRTLIRLRNTGAAKTRDIVWDSDLGSDGQAGEGVRDSSNNDTTFQLGDRWVVSSDTATDPPDDPALTHVLFGRSNPREKTVEVINEPESGSGCFSVRFSVRVPGHSTRYLLFFTEMNRTNAGASNKAGKFNDRNLNRKLLSGLSPSVRNQILNWDL
jgi:hypothetical protein